MGCLDMLLSCNRCQLYPQIFIQLNLLFNFFSTAKEMVFEEDRWVFKLTDNFKIYIKLFTLLFSPRVFFTLHALKRLNPVFKSPKEYNIWHSYDKTFFKQHRFEISRFKIRLLTARLWGVNVNQGQIFPCIKYHCQNHATIT